jgi:predicted site-specific integrase-resolvase
MENYLSPKEVMEKTKLKYGTVLKWANIGILPATIIRSGRKSKYLFPEKELQEKLRSLRKEIL